MQGCRTNTEYTGSLGYKSVCYIKSRIGWVSLRGIFRYKCRRNLGKLYNTFFNIRILTKDQPPRSNLVVYSTMQCSTLKIRGFAKKGYTSLFLRQKGAHLKNIWAIYTKRSIISYCAPFWRKNTEEYPPVSIQLNMYPLFAVEITPFWRKHDIISGAK